MRVCQLIGTTKDWHQVRVVRAANELVNRVTARILVGPELCRDEKWLDAAGGYAMAGFAAGALMKLCPRSLKVMVSYLNPACRKAERLVKQGRECIMPVLEKRRQEKKSGSYTPNDDAIDWFESRGGDHYDPVDSQLALATAAVWTSTFVFSTILGDVAANPDIHQRLREEIRQSFSEHGCSKAALQELKLMDSCIHESARLNPQSLGKHPRD